MLSIDQSAMNSSNSSRIRGAFMAVLFVIFTASISAFTTQQSTSSSLVRPISTTTSLSAAPSNIKPKPYDPSYKSKPPTFNKETQLWEPSAETEPQPYGPFGSLLRGGPTPTIIRIVSPNDYDQAVYKYMSQTSCSRAEAQGNMDAFFNNGADWAYQKSEEARGRPRIDYTELKPEQAILVITWALFVTPFIGRCAYLIAFSEKGWSIGLDDIMNF